MQVRNLEEKNVAIDRALGADEISWTKEYNEKKTKTKKAEYRPWETSVFKGQKRVGIVKDVLSTR